MVPGFFWALLAFFFFWCCSCSPGLPGFSFFHRFLYVLPVWWCSPGSAVISRLSCAPRAFWGCPDSTLLHRAPASHACPARLVVSRGFGSFPALRFSQPYWSLGVSVLPGCLASFLFSPRFGARLTFWCSVGWSSDHEEIIIALATVSFPPPAADV
jgi:hypothetical protein